jgi:cell division protein FtsB
MNESRNFNDREFEKMLVWKVTSLNMDIDVLEDENTRLQYEIDKYKKENNELREKLSAIGGVGDDM